MHRWDMRPLIRLALLPLIALSLSAGVALATVVEPLTLEAMIGRSSLIARARVLGLEVMDLDGRYVTRVTLSVTDPVKGSAQAGARVEVDVLGGTLGPLTQRVAGEARFSVGEDVVVCLEAVGGRFVVLGMSLGKFTVTPTPGGLLLRRDITGLEVALVGGPSTPAHALLPAELPLDALRDAARGAPALAPGRP